jgi:signal transduction histidine kinase
MEVTLAEIKDCQKGLVVDEKIATIAKFASVMAHELKNPLSSLKNISYYLIKAVKCEDPKAKRMMEMLSSEVDRANEMITDFSDIARAKRLSKKNSNVSEAVQNALDNFKIDPPIELVNDIETGIEANIDPDRTAQALKNLLKNAKASIIEKGQIKVTLKKIGNSFMLSVTDTGSGILPENISHIYEPLFTTKTKSLGLGLTVVKETVEAQGGRIEVESEKDKGTTFRVYIPL